MTIKKYKGFLFASYDGGARYPGSRIGPGVFLQWVTSYNPNLLKDFEIKEIPIKTQSSNLALSLVHDYVYDSLNGNKFTILFGGDHSITVPSIEAFVKKYGEKCNIVILDAHDDFDSNQLTLMNWNVLNYILKYKEARVALLGTRFPTDSLNEYKNLKIVSPLENDLTQKIDIKKVITNHLDLDLPTYISLDLDVFNLHEFPGVSNGEPGGFSFLEVLTCLKFILKTYDTKILDCVEFNPTIEKEISLKTLNSLLRGVLKN